MSQPGYWSLLSRLLMVGLAVAGHAASSRLVNAQSAPTAEQIIERLKSAPQTAPTPKAGADGTVKAQRHRGISAAPPPGGYAAPPAVSAPAPSSASKEAVDRLLAKPPAALSLGERSELANVAREKPSLDLTIYFDFNSSEIGPKAVPVLVEIGRALSSPALKDARILVAGHTDGKGGDTYNLRLSQRRADAIKRYLIEQFRVEPSRVLAIGYGKEQLLDRAHPFADQNRRVQLVNFGG